MVAKCVLRYLKGTVEYGFFCALREITLNACCDSNGADNLDGNRNTTSYDVFLCSNLIS